MVAVIIEIDLTETVCITIVSQRERKRQERTQRRQRHQRRLLSLVGGNKVMAWTGGLILTSEIFMTGQERPSILIAGFGLLGLGLPPMAPK